MITPAFKPIRKAVFPVAGLGTRFLPATKSVPKEMLTIVDRPLIQFVVDEAREAGIEQFVFVTGRSKNAIEDYFDNAFELETTLQSRGKIEELVQLARHLPPPGSCLFVRQQQPLGLGHAIWCARQAIGDEPFAVLLPDMLMHANPGCLRQMIDVYGRHGGNVIASEEVPESLVHRYGVLADRDWQGNAFAVDRMVEKPGRGQAPSNLIISGRYILQPEIFAEIERSAPGAGGEIQITDAMARLVKSQPFHGVKYRGKTYDCGDRMGFLLANVAYGLSHREIAGELEAGISRLLADAYGAVEKTLVDSDLRKAA